MPQLSRYCDIATVGFSTGQAAVELDTANCEGVLFLGVIASTAARTPTLTLKSGATTTGFATCASTYTQSSTAAGVIVLATDVYKPARRYLGATLTTTSATPSYCIAIKYGCRSLIGNMGGSGTNMNTANGGILRCVSPTSAT